MERVCGTNQSFPSVPRSKGCGACVSRRVRCDGRRPTCRNCDRRKQTCPGYRRGDIIFLNEGWKAPGIASANNTRCDRMGETSNLHPAPGLVCNKLAMHISFFLSEFGQVSTEENDFFFQTLRRSCDSLLSRRPSDPEGQNLDPFLLAVEALVESHFSRVHGDARLSKESMIVYGQALRRMSIELERTNFASIQELAHEQWENLVFCCLTLALCELSMNSGSTNWQRHINALANLVELRGPKCMHNAASRELVSLFGLFIVLDSLSERQPIFLASPPWEGVFHFQQLFDRSSASASSRLYKLIHGPWSSYEVVLGELSVIPGLMAEYDEFERERRLNKKILHQKKRRLDDSVTAALERTQRIITYHQYSLVEISVEQWHSDRKVLAGDDQGPLFDKLLYFSSPLEHPLLNICWTAAIALHLLLCPRNGGFRQDTESAETDGGEYHTTALVHYAEQVLRSVDFGFLPESMGAAPFFFAPSLKMSYAALERVIQLKENTRNQLQYCQRMMIVIQGSLQLASRLKIAVKVDV